MLFHHLFVYLQSPLGTLGENSDTIGQKPIKFGKLGTTVTGVYKVGITHLDLFLLVPNNLELFEERLMINFPSANLYFTTTLQKYHLG